jgi:hypothetical protein
MATPFPDFAARNPGYWLPRSVRATYDLLFDLRIIGFDNAIEHLLQFQTHPAV